MSSFYGNGGGVVGISEQEVDEKIEASAQELKNHVIVSKTQPTIQKAGDIWFVMVSIDQEEENNE